MNDREDLERGRLAAEVLENPVFRDAFDRIQQEIVTKWQGEKEERQREWLWSMSQACKRLESVLTEAMNNGLVAQKQLDLHQSRAERFGQKLRNALR